MTQQRLLNDEQFAHTCTKCGHGVEQHISGYGCKGMVGALECKCYRFASNPPPPRPPEET